MSKRKNPPKTRILKSRLVYKGKRIDLLREEVATPSGKKVLRETVRHPGSCVIVPLLPGKRILLIRQHRASVRKSLWEFPAGTLESGEPLKACAKRELAEETGYRTARLQKMATFYPSPGFCTEKMHLFLASQLTQQAQGLEEDEAIRVRVFPLKKAVGMIRSGAIQDAKTIIGLLILSNSL